jgi:xanthine dehydrogenase accessory factor
LRATAVAKMPRMKIYAEIVRLQELGEACALCTIVKTTGSTPGKEMMKMLVRSDGTFLGTVGGGCLEAEVLEAALEAMGDEKSRTLGFSLNERDYPDSGLLCGGKIEIFVEPIVQPRLYIFGGGHISGAITRVASLSGFKVTVGDDRESFASAEKHPAADRCVFGEFGEQVGELAPADGMFVVVVTRGHQADGEILFQLSKHGCRPRYLGMIGSRAKKVQVFEQLRERGVADEFLEGVRTPMGLPIGALTHEEIAVSVVAELIKVRRMGQ